MPRARSNPARSIVIIGAGPVGVEAAIYARALGHDPKLLERGAVGEHVRRWGFVELFSPGSMNVSPLGAALLREKGASAPDASTCPTGAELVSHYLEPLASILDEEGILRTGCEVIGVARQGLLKTEAIAATGSTERAHRGFRLLARQRQQTGESVETTLRSDVVIDATGVYATHGHLGDGGIPAPGESGCQERIVYHLPDVLGEDRETYAGRTTLLVGAGHSAMTVLRDLIELETQAPSTRIIWVRRDRRPAPARRVSDDPLAERDRLASFANKAARSPPPHCTVKAGVEITSMGPAGDRVLVQIRDEEKAALETILVDRIVAMVGYRPDLSIHRELQVHHCYASEGPMKLAAALLGGDGDGDCLAPRGGEPDTLRNPEPSFFVVGHKSYGRRSEFLLRIGREQIRDVFRLIEGDESLDLYAATSPEQP